MISVIDATELINRWKDEARERREWDNTPAATALEKCIADLQETLTADQEPLLNLTQASEWSGYSTRQLQRHVEAGKLLNHGRKNAPKFRRGELPVKPGHHLPTAPPSPNVDEIVRSVVNRREVRDE